MQALVTHAMLMSQDPVRGNFVVAVVLFTLMVALAMYAAIMQRWEERSSQSFQVQSPSSLPKAIDELQFTPGLVVPEGCECVLLICSKPKRGMTYDVIDSGGGVVLRMEDTEAALPKRKLLTTSKVLLGQCVRTQQSFPSQTSLNSEITFEISNANHAVYAKLTYEPRQGRDDKVFIETVSQKFLLIGSIQHQTLNLTDLCGRLLATTEPVTQQGPRGEPPGSLLRLRVAPLADVGLILCCLMCVQHISPGW
eukprot:Skav201534  [mRNA]  locus=scaffold1616:79093:79848:+ [translate_table: standard]